MTARKTATKPAVASGAAMPDTAALRVDLRQVIEQARQAAAVAVNSGLTLMYWHIGRRIGTGVLGGQRAPYGGQIVATLSRQLVADYGRGFEEKNLRRVKQFVAGLPDEAIVATRWRQLHGIRVRELTRAEKTRPSCRRFFAPTAWIRSDTC